MPIVSPVPNIARARSPYTALGTIAYNQWKLANEGINFYKSNTLQQDGGWKKPSNPQPRKSRYTTKMWNKNAVSSLSRSKTGYKVPQTRPFSVKKRIKYNETNNETAYSPKTTTKSRPSSKGSSVRWWSYKKYSHLSKNKQLRKSKRSYKRRFKVRRRQRK